MRPAWRLGALVLLGWLGADGLLAYTAAQHTQSVLDAHARGVPCTPAAPCPLPPLQADICSALAGETWLLPLTAAQRRRYPGRFVHAAGTTCLRAQTNVLLFIAD